jgi:cell division protein FtsN
MSRRKALSRLDSQRGNTLVGLIIGVVVGLAIAAGVALFVTKATVPFVSKPPRVAVVPEPEGTKLPDPNKGLYAKDTLPSASSSVPTSTPSDNVVIAPPPPNLAPGADGKAPVIVQTPPNGITGLQAGAFSNAEDAESMRGRLALLGFESRVQPAERDGAKIFRVRLGPYARIEDLNHARQLLIENGVEATLVAPGK